MGSYSDVILYSNDEYEIRPARSLDEFRELWWGFMQNLGWDRGFYDLDTYMNPSIGYGMILLIEKATQKPVGHVSAVINNNSTGWVSMFIVDEPHRGKGMGGELFKAAMADFERNKTKIMGLDGVPQQRNTYARRGFVESLIGNVTIMVRNLVAKLPIAAPTPAGHLVDLRQIPYKILVEHELQNIGFERPRLWNDENLFNRRDVLGVALVDKASPQSVEDVRGWAMIRRCSNGVRLGPVYASDSTAAEAVVASVLNLATPDYIKSIPLPNEPMNAWSDEQIADKATVVVEVWSGNSDAVSLFEKAGWSSSSEDFGMAHRMWVDDKATPEHSAGGRAQKGVFAIFDAAVG